MKKVIGARVLVDIPKVEESEVGLMMATDTVNTPVKGIITIVGDKANKWYSRRFKVGQTIYFRKYAVDEIKYMTPSGEKKVYLVDTDEVLVME